VSRRELVALLGALLLSAACVTALYLWLLPLTPRLVLFGAIHELRSPAAGALLGLWPLLGWGLLVSLADLPLLQRLLSLGARGSLLAVLALALAQPSRISDATRVSAVVLVDVSDSITDADLGRAQRWLQAAQARAAGQELQVVTFAAHARVLRPTDAGALPPLRRHGPEHGGGAASDLQAALQLSYGLFAPGQLRHAVLLSDGLETHGDVLAEAGRAASLGVRVGTLALQAGRPAELALRALELPDRIMVGRTFPVRVRVFASRPGKARLRLYQDAALNALDPLRELDLPEGETELRFESVVRIAGRVSYRARLEPLAEDHFASNNEVSATAVVPGKPSVLLVDGEPARATALAQALAVGEYAVDLRGPAALPRTLAELERHDFFILSDVAADQLSGAQMELIERYVRDLGGGFLMAGGEHSFGLGGYQNTRLERLLPVRMDSDRRRDEHSLALALVIDSSGSMAGPKLELAKEAARATAELLGPDDSLGVIGFSGRPERMVRMQSARNRVKIESSIGQLAAQGGTAIVPALEMAFQDLLSTRARIKHVILLTDGVSQESGLTELAGAMRSEAITVSSVGLGGDVNRSLLQNVANQGGGRAYFTNDPHNVPRIFMRETTAVSRSSVVEELIEAHLAEPADFLKGIELGHAPLLRGYVATQLAPRPAQAILVSDLGEPLLARGRVGLGWALAWTPDVKARWSADWLRWSQFARFWGQLVREHMRARPLRELGMGATLVDGEARLSLDALDQDDSFMNGLDSRVRVEGPAGFEPVTLPLQQVAPGRYLARVRLPIHGAYTFAAEHRRDGQLLATSRAQLGHPYPPEYDPRPPDLERLTRLAELGGGSALATPEALFEPGAQRLESRTPLWPWLVGLAIGLFLLDLLLRRVRLFDRDFRSESRGGFR
jgi:Ca-activated chloride channel family protein